MAELVDAQDLKSCDLRSCGFESHLGYSVRANCMTLDEQLIGPHTNMNALTTGVSQKDGSRLWCNRISNAAFYYKSRDGFIAISDRGLVSFNLLRNGRPVTLAKTDLELEARIWNSAVPTGFTKALAPERFPSCFSQGRPLLEKSIRPTH